MPVTPRGRGRRILFVALVIATAAAIFIFLEIGQFMAREDPLEQADAIFVFAGTRVERPLEAADLYRAGYAPRVIVTRAVAEQGTAAAERRGVRIATDVDLSKDVLFRVGVPAGALIVPTRIHDNTAEEVQTLRDLITRNKWQRVILVSSKYHLRRIRLAASRALAGSGAKLILRGSRYDAATPRRWWHRRSDIRWLASEVPKLLIYSLGLG